MMLRLAVFLGVVLVLFQAGTRNVASPPAAAPAPVVARTPENTTVQGPYLAASAGPSIAFPDWEPASDPVPFDLSTTTAADPRLLVGSATAAAEPDNIWRVAVPRLSLRSGPSSAYSELGALTEGQTVISDGIGGGDWIWVRTEDSALSGYIASRLLTR